MSNYRGELVKEVREGRLAIWNNGTLEELRELLKYCFPEDVETPSGNCLYYSKCGYNLWIGKHKATLTSKSVKEFYMKEETKYSKEDWINGKVALEWENDKAEKINKFFKECDNTNIIVLGKYKYYYCNSSWKGHYTCENTTNLPIVKIDDIMEEEFVLPEKWCIKATRLDCKEGNPIFEWRKNQNTVYGYNWYSDGYLNYNCIFSAYKKEDHQEITYEQFLKYVVKMEEKQEFPKDDFGVIVENGNGKEILDYLVNKGFVNYKNWTGGTGNGTFYTIKKYSNIIENDGENTTSQVFNLEQLKQLDSNNMEKKILGYKVIDNFEKYVRSFLTTHNLTLMVHTGNINFYKGSLQYDYFEKAGVLDIWFTPVYEPEKPKEKTITLSNNKLVKVTKEGVIVEGKTIVIASIEGLYNENFDFDNTGWKLKINNFDIGCYKNLNRKDLENILEAYKSIN